LNSDDRAELEELGWNERFASAFDALVDEGVEPGRLAADYGTKFLVQLAGSAPLATLGSALREARLVAVGDWVAVRNAPDAEIRAVLPRQSAITREAPGSETAAQVIAANVDLVFIATSADTDFNLRRIERLLTVAYQSGAAPVIVPGFSPNEWCAALSIPWRVDGICWTNAFTWSTNAGANSASTRRLPGSSSGRASGFDSGSTEGPNLSEQNDVANRPNRR